MKFIMTAWFIISFGFTAVAAVEPSDKLIQAMIQVESEGNGLAIGDKGKAYGCLQLWNSYIQDVNRIYKTSYRHKDAFNRCTAIEITKKYLTFYGKIYMQETGKQPTDEVFARMHNGGPTGYKKSATIEYWQKVKKELR
jgi:soluble lytic murein transglycosylase-like protein